MFIPGLPHFAKGLVIRGFGRGARELKCPTANFSFEVVQKLPNELESGVYFGYAQLEKGDIHEMVTSIGWNPFYQNSVKSMEIHILHEFEKDFYGEELKIIILGHIRPQRNFENLNELMDAINNDIIITRETLRREEVEKYKNHPFFRK